MWQPRAPFPAPLTYRGPQHWGFWRGHSPGTRAPRNFHLLTGMRDPCWALGSACLGLASLLCSWHPSWPCKSPCLHQQAVGQCSVESSLAGSRQHLLLLPPLLRWAFCPWLPSLFIQSRAELEPHKCGVQAQGQTWCSRCFFWAESCLGLQARMQPTLSLSTGVFVGGAANRASQQRAGLRNRLGKPVSSQSHGL